MILIDIGNTTATIYDNGKIQAISVAKFNPNDITQKVFFINVNTKITSFPKNFINLEKYFNINTNYIGLGIDRIAACYAIDNGVIVDVGSAITVDKVINKQHLGGFILPGIKAYINTYKNISTKLDYELNQQIDLKLLPNYTQNAISYGILKSIILSIQDFAQNEIIYLTGGDFNVLSPFLNSAKIKKDLIFKGMLKLIKDLNL